MDGLKVMIFFFFILLNQTLYVLNLFVYVFWNKGGLGVEELLLSLDIMENNIVPLKLAL